MPLGRSTLPLVIACDTWQDPRNVGLLFRLADGLGVEHILLGNGTPAPPHKKIARVARSTHSWVPYTVVDHLAEALIRYRSAGYTLLGLEITDQSQSIYTTRFLADAKYVLVAGSERSGIRPDILALLDSTVHIPMYGRVSSLNVSMALAVTIGELGRQLRD